MEYIVGLALLFSVGVVLGFIFGGCFHSGGGAEGGMIEGAFWMGVGQFVSIIIFLFLGLKDSGAWAINYFFN